MRLSPGMPALIPSAAEWNRHVDASEDYQRRKALGEGGGVLHGPLPLDVVKVRNDTTADRAMGAVVELSTHLIDELDREHPTFAGATPDVTRAFAILMEPIPDGEIGLAQIAGRVPALVNVSDVGHGYARLENSTVLKSDTAGPVRMLAPATQTGEQLLWVQLPLAVPPGPRLIVLEEGNTLSQGGTASVREVVRVDGVWKLGSPFTVWDFFFNQGEFIDGPAKGIAFPLLGVWVPIFYCPPSNTLPTEEA